jgi:selenoprotein W-related protein
LIDSGGGVFEVVADGNLIFSKKALGRFPEDEEVFKEIRSLQSA